MQPPYIICCMYLRFIYFHNHFSINRLSYGNISSISFICFYIFCYTYNESYDINPIRGTARNSMIVPHASDFCKLLVHKKLFTGHQATPPKIRTIKAANKDKAMQAAMNMKNALNITPIM